MPGDRFLMPLWMAALACGCAGPSLELPDRQGESSPLVLYPPVDAGRIGSTFRGQIRGAPLHGAPWLLRGELSDYHERAIARGEVSSVLRERAVPLRYWRDEQDCWLQPLEWLAAGDTYTLAWQGAGALGVLEPSSDPRPTASQLFPAPGRPKHRVAVVCDLPGAATALGAQVLEPGRLSLELSPGVAGVPRAGCVTLSAAQELDEPAVSPPELDGLLLDPSPWLPPSASATLARAPSCAGELLGGACLEVDDERVFVTPQSEDQLWLLEEPRSALGLPVALQRTLLLEGLAPETRATLRGWVLSSSGALEQVSAELTTSPARRHLVLNEVLANPLGTEATSEWIELLNDSERPAALGDLRLFDDGGSVALPEAELEPGELVLLVASGFRASGADVPLPEGVRLLRLPSLGTRGLSNSGEALRLVGPEGPISVFPALAAKHAGASMARRTPGAADDDAQSFAEHGSPGASPGAPNSF